MEIVPVYVGLDYHSDSIRVCVLDQQGETLVNRSVANDPGTVRDLVRCHGGLVVAASIEACCGAAEFATALSDLTEWTVRMAHPSRVSRMKDSPDKTDHSDAWHLANLLRVGYLPTVWLADHTTRQLRRLVRFRAGIVAHRKDIKLRMLSLLREERIENTSGASTWSKPWMAWVKFVALGVQSRWVLDQELRRLEQAESSGLNQSDAGLIEAGNDILRGLLIQLSKRLPRQEPRWKQLHEKLRIKKGANVASAAIANRWLRRLFHEMVTKPKMNAVAGILSSMTS